MEKKENKTCARNVGLDPLAFIQRLIFGSHGNVEASIASGDLNLTALAAAGEAKLEQGQFSEAVLVA